jgi:lysozyme
VIDELIEDLKRDEGWRGFIYDDATGEPIVKGSVVQGYPTIGFGFCVSEDRGAELPGRIGEDWLRHAVLERWNRLVTLEPWLQEQPEDVQRAVANMAYQLGVEGVRRFRKMLAALKDGDRRTAAAEALNSRWSEQTPERARRVAALIRGGA